MTHSNHRQGNCSNLIDDFVVLARVGRKGGDPEAALQRFRDIGARQQAVNVPGVESSMSGGHLVYDSPEKVLGVIKDLAAADLGLSIVVSGLHDRVEECCHAAGLDPYVVNLSLGIWGNTAALAHQGVLEITTMCGHGRVSPNLAWDLAGQVRRGRSTCKQAARKMGKLCLCNIFNEVRAARLMEGLVAGIEAGSIHPPEVPTCRAGDIPRKDSGITIDEERCTGCLECLPYCPVSAIVEVADKGTAVIDPARCTECGVCWQPGSCPTGAIVASELSWPRTLRGKFQNPHAPYRATPLMARVSPPLNPSGRVQMSADHPFANELSDDFRRLLQPGENVIVVEPGRPHVAASFRDVQKMVQALLPAGLDPRRQYPPSDERTPLTELMADVAKGVFRQDILDERTGWVVLKLLVSEKERSEVLRILQQAAAEIDTVFAVNLVCRVEDTVSGLIDGIAAETGIRPAINGKTNVGLGVREHNA